MYAMPFATVEENHCSVRHPNSLDHQISLHGEILFSFFLQACFILNGSIIVCKILLNNYPV